MQRLIDDFLWLLDRLKIGDRVSKWVDEKTDNLERRIVAANPELCNRLADMPFLPASLRDVLRGNPRKGHAVQILALLPLLAFALMPMVQYFLEPIIRAIREASNKVLPNVLLDPPEIIAAYYRGTLSKEDALGHLQAHGFDRWHGETMIANAATLLSVEECIELELRGKMQAAEVERRAQAQGVSADDVNHKRELRQVLPSIGDLIMMQVRDAFNEEVISLYQLASGDYSKVSEYAKQQGYKPEWTRRNWVAHWEYPSPTMAAEMVQRLRNAPENIRFTEDDFRRLLRIADYAPYFIERMLALTYQPLTRVDLRRLYQNGQITFERMVEGYRRLGYAEEDAKALAEFAAAGASETEKDLSRSDVLGAYGDGIFTREEAVERLVLLGYDAAEADVYLARVDLEETKAEIKDETDAISKAVRTGDLTVEEGRAALGELGLTGKAIDRYILQWSRQRAAKPKMPNKTDFDRFLKAEIIPESEYREALEALGYGERYIGYYIALIRSGGESGGETAAEAEAGEEMET